jgi:hypothetical protein
VNQWFCRRRRRTGQGGGCGEGAGGVDAVEYEEVEDIDGDAVCK